jgi:uncharacterized protein
MSNPWDLQAAHFALQRSWFRRNTYSKALGANIRELFNLHADQLTKNPSIDADRVREIRHLYEFDRLVQCPTWGYRTEGEYYRHASSVDSVLAIRIPFLAIHAEDDPVSTA